MDAASVFIILENNSEKVEGKNISSERIVRDFFKHCKSEHVNTREKFKKGGKKTSTLWTEYDKDECIKTFKNALEIAAKDKKAKNGEPERRHFKDAIKENADRDAPSTPVSSPRKGNDNDGFTTSYTAKLLKQIAETPSLDQSDSTSLQQGNVQKKTTVTAKNSKPRSPQSDREEDSSQTTDTKQQEEQAKKTTEEETKRQQEQKQKEEEDKKRIEEERKRREEDNAKAIEQIKKDADEETKKRIKEAEEKAARQIQVLVEKLNQANEKRKTPSDTSTATTRSKRDPPSKKQKTSDHESGKEKGKKKKKKTTIEKTVKEEPRDKVWLFNTIMNMHEEAFGWKIEIDRPTQKKERGNNKEKTREWNGKWSKDWRIQAYSSHDVDESILGTGVEIMILEEEDFPRMRGISDARDGVFQILNMALANLFTKHSVKPIDDNNEYYNFFFNKYGPSKSTKKGKQEDNLDDDDEEDSDEEFEDEGQLHATPSIHTSPSKPMIRILEEEILDPLNTTQPLTPLKTTEEPMDIVQDKSPSY